MTVEQQNFFRLLRAGAFGQTEQVEPMSAWKWRHLYAVAKSLQLSPIIHDGVTACHDQFFMQLPDNVQQALKADTERAEQEYATASADVAELLLTLGTLQFRPILMEPWPTALLYPVPAHRPVDVVGIYYPYATQGTKADEWGKASDSEADSSYRYLLRYHWKNLSVEHRHRMQQLSSRFTNQALQHILEQEWLDGGTSHIMLNGQRIETVPPTLYMLLTFISIVRQTILQGLSLYQVIDVGQQLRRQGDRIDFVKLTEWTERLHIGRMVLLMGQVLTELLGFTPDEVPFMQEKPADTDALANSLLPDRNGLPKQRYRRFSPGESIANAVANITHSLGNVQE